MKRKYLAKRPDVLDTFVVQAIENNDGSLQAFNFYGKPKPDSDFNGIIFASSPSYNGGQPIIHKFYGGYSVVVEELRLLLVMDGRKCIISFFDRGRRMYEKAA